MTKSRALGTTALLVLASAALAGPALGGTCTITDTSCSLGTTAQLVVPAGGLTLDVTTSGTTVTLEPAEGVAAILPGAATTGSLGTTTVTDTRGLSTGWTVAISATDFVDGADTIALSEASATVAAGTVGQLGLPATCGLGVVTFSTTPMALTGTPQQLAKCAVLTGFAGSNSAQWSNMLSVTVPATAAPGTYTSTITQSVQ